MKVWLPKFKLTSQFGLNDSTLVAWACRWHLIPSKADFSGIDGQTRFVSFPLSFHKAYVDVYEEGTEAAAATGVIVGDASDARASPPEFRADHPFVFADS